MNEFSNSFISNSLRYDFAKNFYSKKLLNDKILNYLIILNNDF